MFDYDVITHNLICCFAIWFTKGGQYILPRSFFFLSLKTISSINMFVLLFFICDITVLRSSSQHWFNLFPHCSHDMDVIGFTDEELSKLNNRDTPATHSNTSETHSNDTAAAAANNNPATGAHNTPTSTKNRLKQTRSRTSGQRKERASNPATKHAQPIGQIREFLLPQRLLNENIEVCCNKYFVTVLQKISWRLKCLTYAWYLWIVSAGPISW